MNTFIFTDRETYLNWRANWKRQYKENSVKIRELKNKIRDTQKANGYAGMKQYERESLRAKQYNAIEYLKEAKIEAQKQYEQTLNLNAVEA